MKKLVPVFVFLLLVSAVVVYEISDRTGWKPFDISSLQEKIKEKATGIEKNKPFVKKVHYKNDPTQPVKRKLTLIINDKGETIRHGENLRYFKNGTVASRMNYIQGKREGTCYMYHTNGKVWKVQEYKNGKLNGMCKRYDRSGNLSADYFYKHGLPGMGLKEYTNLGKLRDQPELKVEKVNEIKKANKFILKFSLAGEEAKRYEEISYYLGELVEGSYFSKNMEPAGELNGKEGQLEINIPKGYVLDKTLNVVVVAKNTDGLTLILQKEVPVSVRGI